MTWHQKNKINAKTLERGKKEGIIQAMNGKKEREGKKNSEKKQVNNHFRK